MDFTKDARQEIEDWLRQVMRHMTLPEKDLGEVERELRSSLYERSEVVARERGAETVTKEYVRKACAEEQTPDEIAACYAKTYAMSLHRTGFWRKTAAYAIDLIIITLIFSMIFLPIIILSEIANLMPPASSPVYLLTFIAIPFFYFILLEGYFGTTIGKYVLGLRIVKTDGTMIGFKEAVLRNITTTPWFLVIVFDVLIMLLFFSRERQRAFDRVADTTVVSMWSYREVGELLTGSDGRDKPDWQWTYDKHGGRKAAGDLSRHVRAVTRLALMFVAITIAVAIVTAPFMLILIGYVSILMATDPGFTDSSAGTFSDNMVNMLEHNLAVGAGLGVLNCLILVAVAIFFLTIVDKKAVLPKAPAFQTASLSARWFIAGVAISMVLLLVQAAYFIGTGMAPVQANEPSTYSPITLGVSVALTVIIALADGIGVEMLLRKYLQSYLMDQYSTAFAVVATSIAFIGLYLLFSAPGLEPHGILNYMSLFMLSLVLGYLYVITGSIWVSIGFHAGYFATMLNFPLAGQVLPDASPLLIFSSAGDLMVLGVNLGSRTYLVITAASLAILAGLYLYRRMSLKPVKQGDTV
ncbi:MAG TPA: RDD family protein [Methanocella sp.]|nr:RDD family protein [Methanocella sp.]